MNKSLFILLTLFLMTACSKKSGPEAEDIAKAVESGLAGMIGAVDEEGSEDVSDNFLAACSGRAVDNACSGSGRKTISYSNCTIGTTSLTLNGSVNLDYSDTTNCDLNTNGETVTRTYSLERTTIFGGTVTVTSSSSTNYLGASVFGGGKLTKTAAGWNLEVLGKRRLRKTSGGTTVIDISMKTTSPIAVTGNLLRSGRTINGGVLEVYHNLAEYTASMVPNNITYTSGCCYPTGGSVTITYTGKVTGSATVTFTSCGTAKVEKGDTSHPVQFYSCE